MPLQETQQDSTTLSSKTKGLLRKGFIIVGGLIIFLVAIDLMGSSFKLLGTETAENILQVTENPFIGLFIGLLMTAIIQSSSTSTALMVTAVASGSIGVEQAMPMVLGANIGTTLTSTIISLGYLTRKTEFRKAFAAGTLHDLFNILVVIVLFPLEVRYQFLSRSSRQLVEWLSFGHGNPDQTFSFRLYDLLPFTDWISAANISPIVFIVTSFALLMVSIKYLSKSLSGFLIGESKDRLQNYLFGSKRRSFLWGTLITAGVQSSSITTSLIVPFVATRKVTLNNAFPFIMGANIGTTITAIIAASFRSEAAISLAVAHLLFNLTGVLLFSLPYVREFPVFLANNFGKLALKFRLTVIIYILVTFFILPFSLIKLNDSQKEADESTSETTEQS